MASTPPCPNHQVEVQEQPPNEVPPPPPPPDCNPVVCRRWAQNRVCRRLVSLARSGELSLLHRIAKGKLRSIAPPYESNPVRGSEAYKERFRWLCYRMGRCGRMCKFAQVLSDWEWFQWLSRPDSTQISFQFDTDAAAELAACIPASMIKRMNLAVKEARGTPQMLKYRGIRDAYVKLDQTAKYPGNSENFVPIQRPDHEILEEIRCVICLNDEPLRFECMGEKATPKIGVINHQPTFIYPTTVESLPLLKHEKECYTLLLKTVWRMYGKWEVKDRHAWCREFDKLCVAEGNPYSSKRLDGMVTRCRLEVICRLIICSSVERYLIMSPEEREVAEKELQESFKERYGALSTSEGYYFEISELLSSFVEGKCTQHAWSEGAVKTSCGHIFGLGCLRKWFQSSAVCPLCRTQLVHGGEPQGTCGGGVRPLGLFIQPCRVFCDVWTEQYEQGV